MRALVLTPTRELAAQVEESVRTYGKYLPRGITVIYGGVDMKPQTKALQGGVEWSPRRAAPRSPEDEVDQPSQVQILVMDEADRMLDIVPSGYPPDPWRLARCPAKPVVFRHLLGRHQETREHFHARPLMIEVARRNALRRAGHAFGLRNPATRKHELLAHLVKPRDMKQVLIFVRMKRDAEKLSRQLQRDGFEVAALHGDRTQAERTQALDDFKAGKIRCWWPPKWPRAASISINCPS